MFAEGSEILMAGLVQITDTLVVQPKDIVWMYVLDKENDYNTEIVMRGTSNIKTSATIDKIVKALSGATRL